MDIDKAKQSITAARDTLKAVGPEGLHADAAAAAAGNLDDALNNLGGDITAPPAETAPPAPAPPPPATVSPGTQAPAGARTIDTSTLSDDELEDEIERRSQERRDAARGLT